MSTIKCFLIESTGRTILSARRYSEELCTQAAFGKHDAETEFSRVQGNPAGHHANEDEKRTLPFPEKCQCGYVFQEHDVWQVQNEHEYKRADTGELTTINDAPVGAIWRAPWYEGWPEYQGLDGKSYVCKTPGGNWAIDTRAANCTRMDDETHK